MTTRLTTLLAALLVSLGAFAQEYTATTEISGDVSWESISFGEGVTWASASNAVANITLSGAATITLPENFQASAIKFTGNYAVTLKESGTTMSTITTISGSSGVTREIPSGCEDTNLSCPVGMTFVLPTNATATVGFTDQGLKGTLVIEKGATLTAKSSDAPNYGSGSKACVKVYGTLDLATYRWTFKNCELDLFGSATVNGTGDGKGAIDLWNKIVADVAPGESTAAPTINAPIAWSDNNAIVFVKVNVTLTLKGVGAGDYGVKTFAKQGAGTLRIEAVQSKAALLSISSGALELACASAITTANAATITSVSTLRVLSGTYDLSAYTIQGTLDIQGGTVIAPSSATGKVTEGTNATMKVGVTATQWTVDGFTLPDNFTLKEGHTNVVFVYGGSEVTGEGRVLKAQSIRWIGAQGAAWSEASNWSSGTVPTATSGVLIDQEGAVVVVKSTDVAPATVQISSNATLKGALTNFKTIQIDAGMTLTYEGTGTAEYLKGSGTLNLAKGTVLSPIQWPSYLLTDGGFTGTFVGEGAISHTTFPGSTAVQNLMKNPDRWKTTFFVRGNTSIASLDLNLFGNTNSIIRLQGCAGYLKSATSGTTILPTIELIDDDTNQYGFNCNDGSSTDIIEFRKVIGTGAWQVNGSSTRRHFFPDVSAFTGAFKITNQGQTSSIFIGRGRTGYVNNTTTDNQNIFICAPITNEIEIINKSGKIVISDDYWTSIGGKVENGLFQKVLPWSTKPTEGTYGVGSTLAARWRAQKRGDGLYLTKKYGTLIIVN